MAAVLKIDRNHPHAHPTHKLMKQSQHLQAQYDRLNAMPQTNDVAERKRQVMVELASVHAQIQTFTGK